MRNTVLLVVALLCILAGVAAFAYFGLAGRDVALGVHGWTAMSLGTILMLVVGIGLMALMFYSSRHGYDEPPRSESHNAGDEQRR